MDDNNRYRITTEDQLPALYQDTLPAFWRTHAREGSFLGKDGITARYAVLRNPDSRRAIIIVNGRLESYLKYQETALDLYRQGYSLYLIDHRGQGLSDRLLADDHKGHVAWFDDYVEDLKTFHDQVVLADRPQKRFLLAHSMGGTICARYLTRWPDDIDAAALCSPMMGIRLTPLPGWFALGLARLIARTRRRLGLAPGYAPGQGRYRDRPFAGNRLSHSPARYAEFRRLYLANPRVQLGGPTAEWVYEGMLGARRAVVEAGQIRTPLLLLQAGSDSVVTARDQDAFCANMAAGGHPCAGGKPLRIEGARHEILNESDPYRLPALTAILDFFGRH